MKPVGLRSTYTCTSWAMGALLMACTAALSEPPALDFVFIIATDVQPGGPAYDFRISRFEVRNDQFAAFLNDAMQNLGDPPGHYMYFDTDTGDAYVHTTAHGVLGTVGSGTLMFAASANRDLFYSVATRRYEVTPGRESHPATGMTWYGALKFCNWLTLTAGLGVDQRAYTEAPADMLGGWHPVTITTDDWTTRDLNSQERGALLTILGYRLPMDGGDAGGDPSSYNEWYKAGAWDGAAGVNHLHGFGRDTISNQDANFRCSGDPFEDPGDCIVGATAPVGYYDGTNHDGTFQTNADDNAYGLYDMSGNVWEWMQDQSFEQSDRRNRGGSFRSVPTSLELTIGAERSAISATDSTGLRIVQSVVNALLVTPDSELANAGIWGGPYTPGLPIQTTYRVTNVSDASVGFAVLTDAPWITATYQVPAGDVLPAYGFADITIALAPQCAHQLNTGLNVGTLSIVNLEDGWRTNRAVRLTVTEPLTVSPPGLVTITTPFGESPGALGYALASRSQSLVEWTANWADATLPPSGTAWLTLNGDPDGTGGVMEPLANAEVVVGFAIEGLTAGTYSAVITFTDQCTDTQFARPVSVTIEAPFSVRPAAEAVSSGVFGGPFSPPSHLFTIRSLVNSPIEWRVRSEPVAPDTDTGWLELDHTSGSLTAAGAEANVTAAVTLAAGTRQVGRYSATLIFEQLVAGQPTGFAAERVVTLDVTGLRLDPPGDLVFRGPLGGPFEPAFQLCTLHNTGLEEMAWTAEFHETMDPPSGREWLEFSETAGVILNPLGTADVELRLSPQAALLGTGTYVGQVIFTSTATGATGTRRVTLTVGLEGFSVAMVMVPPEDVQPGGPGYLYRIGKYEVTNQEFARFLNDAKDNTASTRGQFLDHDTANNVIRLTGDRTVVYDGAVGGAITFSNARYTVTNGKGALPVVGVSWYGAAKFCNWMTLLQGMDGPDQRTYHEGPTAADWYALLAPSELIGMRGFRLPMDGQAMAAAPYNEWYKAAAWIDSLRVNAVYGFGRDTLRNVDANFQNSGDPYEPGPSPVGFFNGINTLSGDAGRTTDTANGYGLYDMTGNVAEWVHDAGSSPTERGIRGGHFGSLVGSTLLRADGRGSLPADTTLPFLGFRAAQAVRLGDLTVTQNAVRADGLAGGPYSRDSFALAITNLSEQTIDDLTVAVNRSWLAIEGVAPRQVPPGSTIQVSLRIAAAEDPGISPAPSGNFVLVRTNDSQPNGPDHDYWISRTEVTNSLFASFLNDARANALSQFPDVRSAYMYFDLDSGSVYLNDAEPGEAGVDAPSDILVTLLYDAHVGRIHLINNAYVVETGLESHPVVGVSWYGALKYCNWLTMTHAIPTALRAYQEAPSPNLEGWHPVVVDDATWESGPMSAEARRLFVQDTLGYRLPMDDEAGGASPFNEWYKAASRRGVDEQGNPVFGGLYGFGRDGSLTGPDANYLASGDTPTDSTTPVGYFDGIHRLFYAPGNCYPPALDPGATNATANGYGLLDVCGNVAEWVQDLFGGDFRLRATRGGSWRDAVDSTLLTTTGRRSLPPEAVDDQTGFRAVRGTGHVATVTITDHLSGEAYQGHFILDLREPLEVTPLIGFSESGVYGDAFAGRTTSYTVTNRSQSEMQWEVTANVPWLGVAAYPSGELTGVLGGNEQIQIDVEINGLADDLAPSIHSAVVIFRNLTTAQSETRTGVLNIAAPILITALNPPPQAFSGIWGGSFQTPFAVRTFRMTSQVDYDLRYAVEVLQPWLTVEPVDPLRQLSGTLQGRGAMDFEVTIADLAATMPVGKHKGTVQFTATDPAKPQVSSRVEQELTLAVDDPLLITQSADPWLVGPNPDPAVLPPQVYAIVNNAEIPIEVLIDVDADWVDIPYSLIEVPAGAAESRQIPVALNASVLTMYDGEYTASLTFEDTATGIVQCRSILLTIVEDISVAPFSGFVTAGIPGGPTRPPLQLYRVTNVARDGGRPLQWRASISPTDAAWLLVNGSPTYEGVLEDGESASVIVSIDPTRTGALVQGNYHASVQFQILHAGDPVDRLVSLTLSEPAFTPAESLVAGTVRQPGGPAYSYNIGTFHTTNREFVAFLNDAMAHPGDERGQYMYFDTTTGDVYVNSSAQGESGVAPGPRGIKMFSPAASGQIGLVDGEYAAITQPLDFSSHPVTGVSWYGAVKYCNWLTIDQGMLPSERCYTEGTDADLPGWHPVTVSPGDWRLRDLTDDGQLKLVTYYRGYRLPMDDGCNNVDVTTDAADAYNEWYKAASYKGQNARGDAVFGSVYGFGRDGPLTAADANFQNSGDPWDNGATPVGYFNGSIRDGGFTTQSNGNGFGVFDMTGNVYQWIQGRFNTHPSSINFRTLRGGSWDTPADSPDLRTKGRTYSVPHLTDSRVGFRVVRTLEPPTGDANADGNVDQMDYAATAVCLAGPGTSTVPGCGVFDLDIDGDIDLRDVATFQTTFTGASVRR